MVINKVTTLFPAAGATIKDDSIQSHFDQQNADGWQLVAVDNLVGWYRFFWSKVVTE